MNGDFEFVCVYRQTDGLSLPLRRQAGHPHDNKNPRSSVSEVLSGSGPFDRKRCKQQEKPRPGPASRDIAPWQVWLPSVCLSFDGFLRISIFESGNHRGSQQPHQ